MMHQLPRGWHVSGSGERRKKREWVMHLLLWAQGWAYYIKSAQMSCQSNGPQGLTVCTISGATYFIRIYNILRYQMIFCFCHIHTWSKYDFISAVSRMTWTLDGFQRPEIITMHIIIFGSYLAVISLDSWGLCADSLTAFKYFAVVILCTKMIQ